MRTWVWSLASLSGLGTQCCHELWCRSQTWFRSHIAVSLCRPEAAAPIQPLAWELPYAACVALKKKDKNKGREYKKAVPFTIESKRINYLGIISSIKKEWNFAICNNMDGLGGYYTNWKKSDIEKCCVLSLIYDLKSQTNECKKIGQTHRYSKLVITSGYRGGGRGKTGEEALRGTLLGMK